MPRPDGRSVLVENALRPDGRPAPSIPIDGGRIVPGRVRNATRVDADGALVAPGFVDVQINGGFGVDFTTDPSGIWEVARRLPEHGVTSFLPTIVSSAPDTVAAARRVMASGPPAGWRGAMPLGLHCEGPVLSSVRRGTHPEHRLRLPDGGLIDEWGGLDGVRMVTMAPEIEGAPGLISAFVREGVVVSLGHSDCSAAEARIGFDRGATAVTHLFNAMSGLDHRRPGLAAAALVDPRVSAGMIADGVHVEPTMVRLAAEILGPERLVLVTDAIAATGMGDGAFRLGEVTVRVSGGRALSGDDTLAGSTLTMDVAMRNLCDFAGWSIGEAIRSATETPARILGLADRGHLHPGAVADLVFLDERSQVEMTMVAGEIVFRR